MTLLILPHREFNSISFTVYTKKKWLQLKCAFLKKFAKGFYFCLVELYINFKKCKLYENMQHNKKCISREKKHA